MINYWLVWGWAVWFPGEVAVSPWQRQFRWQTSWQRVACQPSERSQGSRSSVSVWRPASRNDDSLITFISFFHNFTFNLREIMWKRSMITVYSSLTKFYCIHDKEILFSKRIVANSTHNCKISILQNCCKLPIWDNVNFMQIH